MSNQTTPKAAHQAVPPRKDRAAEIANTFEWLITAFILAFVFRAFVMEAFRIPTGSMADTLMGAHFRVGCSQCGFRYAHGFVPQRFQLPQDTMPGQQVPLPQVRCPSCGYKMHDSSTSPLELPVDNGDRILVLKCLYQFAEPRRWDVIVFKNPINPAENYIKRLIGLPGEEIEIVDGDIYIDGRIARKPPKVQRELWMPVYSHDYQPVRPDQETFNGENAWKNPWQDTNGAWRPSPEDPTRFVLDSTVSQLQILTYQAESANTSRASYAYNDLMLAGHMPFASDLMVRFYVQSATAAGPIGAAIEKYGVIYEGLVDPHGRMKIFQIDARGGRTTLAESEFPAVATIPATELQFSVVDRRIVLEFGRERLTADLPPERDGLVIDTDQKPHTRILGAGQWTLSHLRLFRDIHYTSQISAQRRGRATWGRPFQLETDEFFVLGDNSPNSEDGRWWNPTEIASRGHAAPRAGVVPRDYLVGKAMFVYWPSGYTFPWPRFIRNTVEEYGQRNRLMRIVKTLVQLRWIPNIGQMRFIYGGDDDPSAQTGIPRPGPENSG